MSQEAKSTSSTSSTSSAERGLEQSPPPPTPQPQQLSRSKLKSKSILVSITKKFTLRAARNVPPPPPVSAEAHERREAALRQMGLRPTLTLSQQEALVDQAIPILPSPTSPTTPQFSSLTDLGSEADRIKKEWESKNKSVAHERQRSQLARMTDFKFGGSSAPHLGLNTEIPPATAMDTDSDSSRPAKSLDDLPSILSSAAHESLSSPNRTSISEMEKCNEDSPLSPSSAREIDASMFPLPPSPSPSRVQGDALSVISSISKASKPEKVDPGLNGGLSNSQTRPSPLPVSPTTEEHLSSDSPFSSSTLETPRGLTPPPPPPVISLSPPDSSPSEHQVEEVGSSEVSQPDPPSNLEVEVETAVSTSPLAPSLPTGNSIPASSVTPPTPPPEPVIDIQPSQDTIPVISEKEPVDGDELIALVAKLDLNRDVLDVVYEEPELLSASGSRVPSRSGSVKSGRRSPSAPKEAARSRSPSRTREVDLKDDDAAAAAAPAVVEDGGKTEGENSPIAKEGEADDEPLFDSSTQEGTVEGTMSSVSVAAPKPLKSPLKRGMTETTERRKSVFNRFKRSNTTSAIPAADATEQVPPLPAVLPKRTPTMLTSVRRKVISTFVASKPFLEPENSDKAFDASNYPPSPTSMSSVVKGIQSVKIRSTSPASLSGCQDSRDLSPVRQPVSPTMHNPASIAFQTNAIEDDEMRRMTELAFLS